MVPEKLEWDEQLLKKYNVSGPRYTSYPTALEFSDDYQLSDYIACLSQVSSDKPLSLYIHVPFCKNICYYCACNKVITKDAAKASRYVDYLIKEIGLVAKLLNAKTLRQIHWGGGTPTFLSLEQVTAIMQAIDDNFYVSKDAEISIEVDPRTLPLDDIASLARLGFNRMSVGIQDFDLKVQQSINRVQSFEMTRDIFIEARNCGFRSINSDLIYGLPHQTQISFEKTLKRMLAISPDRISVFNYAHLPHRFKPQRRILAEHLPSSAEKLAIFEFIIDRLQGQGYRYIGMDHFAKPEDELAVAQQNHCLHRNFQGYTTHGEYALIGVGVSSIGSIGGDYHQNVRDLPTYYEALDKDKLPSWRGATMSNDDKIRRSVIFELICHFFVDKKSIEKRYQIDFNQYFSYERSLLNDFEADALLVDNDNYIRISAKGRLFIRNICMMFDRYLNEMQTIQSYSKVI